MSVLFILLLPAFLHQMFPLPLEPAFNFLEAGQMDECDATLIMSVCMAMRRVIAQHTPVVARVNQMIDICQVVTHNPVQTIHPDFPPQNAAAPCTRKIEPLVYDLPAPTRRHDL